MNRVTHTKENKQLNTYTVSLKPNKSLLPAKIVMKQLGQFASAMAHEVRNPLTNVNLAVEMLNSSTLNDEQKIYLDIISRGTGRINDLVSEILLSYTTHELIPETYSINLLLDEILKVSQDRIMMKHISIHKNYTTLDCEVMVNKHKIKLALTNIIINAIDAMPPIGGELTLTTQTIDNKCMILISDNGVGISKENIKNIFKPYVTNKAGGMGLGLSTTLEILLSHKVGVSVESELGKGTTFSLSFNKLERQALCG
ncbi:MAG TPA: ATP-binding protein [Ferruginibacter sp.]|nr:ATP-binding protein [Ferruginibacter sp.]